MATFTNQATLTYNNITVSSNVVTGEIAETLSISKTAVSDAYSAGETLTYVVSLVNSGSVALTGVTVTDDLGAYDFGGTTLIPLTYTDGSAVLFADGELQPDPAAAVTAGQLVISGITVPANGSAVIVYQAAVNEYASPESGASITNTVTTSGAGAAGMTASAEVPAADEAVLSVAKSLSPCEVVENGSITYTFLIRNMGNTAESGAVLNDTFDPVLKNIAVSMDGTAALSADYTYDELTGEFSTTSGAFTVPAATYTRDPVTGAYAAVPGTTVITVSGTI